MYDQGNILTFDSKKCKIRKKDSSKLVAMASRTPKNVFIFNFKEEETWCMGNTGEF